MPMKRSPKIGILSCKEIVSIMSSTYMGNCAQLTDEYTHVFQGVESPTGAKKTETKATWAPFETLSHPLILAG